MKKILVIEDNHEVRENLVEILQLSGYECEEAVNGKEGVKAVKSFNPDLILCDVMMPELDGFGVLKILNKDPMLMHIPFMFLTAKAEKDDFRKGMGLGADDYITKPYDDVELLEAIEMRLSKSEKLKAVDNSEEGIRTFYNEAKAQEELNKLSDNRELRAYPKKSKIYEESQYAKYLFFVVEGKVKIVQSNEYGKELINQIYVKGDFFGYMPLVLGNKYADSAIAMEETKVRLIPKEDFNILLYNNRDFAAKFINMLAHDADHNKQQLIQQAYSSVRKKVATALLELADKEKAGIITVMREEIAGLAGTAKETTIRTISDFKSEGIVDIMKDGNIAILDKAKLYHMPE